MKWRRINNIIHRDLGYLCFGLTIIYVISGIAVNHIGDWNPTYRVEHVVTAIEPSGLKAMPIANLAPHIINELGETGLYKNSYRMDEDNLKIFIVNNNIQINLSSGEVRMEKHVKRPILYHANFLHLNHAKKLWTFAADIYALCLGFVAITGLFVLRGKKGLKGRGAILTALGIAIPLIFIIFYG